MWTKEGRPGAAAAAAGVVAEEGSERRGDGGRVRGRWVRWRVRIVLAPREGEGERGARRFAVARREGEGWSRGWRAWKGGEGMKSMPVGEIDRLKPS